MLARVERNNLEQYYDRTYSGGLLTRMISLTGVAAVTSYIGVWPPLAAGLWLSAYICGELGLTYYWSRVRSRLPDATLAFVKRVKLTLMSISSVVVTIGTLPFLLTPGHGVAAAGLGILVSTAALMTVAAQHSLSPRMFWFTAPPMALALELNIIPLAEGPTRWLLLLLGVGFLINCWRLQVANAVAYSQLIRSTIDADLASKAKSTFLATMSHEIRTPLNGVLGMAQAMEQDALTDLQRERLDVIRKSGDMLLAILNDILDLSKIEAGKLELEQAPFDLEDLARGAHAAFTAIANKKGLSFDLTVEPGAAGVYVGDSTRVRQILYNLVSNALKFTEAGEVRVRIFGLGHGFGMTVSDTGVGIEPDRVAHLFQKFEQADASTTRKFGGTGLGLSICRELAHLMGGEITVGSVIGRGSDFTVSLPLDRSGEACAPAVSPVAASAPDSELGERTLRVLAAEDNPVNQMVLKTLLHQAGVHPLLVGDGQAALAAWEANDWDLILMDMQMPIMDGLDAARAIRAREAATGRVRTPIIALTANVMSHQIATYLDAGMDQFVGKPIEVGELFAAIEAVLADEGEAPEARVESAA